MGARERTMYDVLLVFDDEKQQQEVYMDIRDSYNVLLAGSDKEAMDIICGRQERVSLIILDLGKDKNANISFLERCTGSRTLHKIPVIVCIDERSGKDVIFEYLASGAWDYVRKPFQKEMFRFRIENTIKSNKTALYRELKYRQIYSNLTGIYNREKFFQDARKVIDSNPDLNFAFIRFDIHKFQAVNQFYGTEEGDRLIRYIADDLSKDIEKIRMRYQNRSSKIASYGHIEVDVFCSVVPYDEIDEILDAFTNIRNRLDNYGLDVVLLPVFGVYLVEDRSLGVNEMYDRANMASKKCKGNYIVNYRFYDDDMGKAIFDEQMIVNDMEQALLEEQFVLYLQPKYDVRDNNLVGAEVLVRWLHPKKGMISPGLFIPIFEQNGFILKLDNYVWDKSCALIRKWMDEGREPFPISVNMSRVSLFNPNVVNIICGLVKKYDIPPKYLQLELTESTFTNDPVIIKDTMYRLQKEGFVVLMDDFGSGYSSLNVLKDMSFDVLKMDMRFLAKTDKPERSKCIMASVVRMAKWLDMSVTAEGVETEEQLEFLKSIGCEYIQGFYFAKPMPVEEYEIRAFGSRAAVTEKVPEVEDDIHKNSLYAYNEEMDKVFSTVFQPLAIYEYKDGEIGIIRVNSAYYNTFGYNDINVKITDDVLRQVVDDENKQRILVAFEEVSDNKNGASCEYERIGENGEQRCFNLNLRYMGNINGKTVIFATLIDVTMLKQLSEQII